jgi:phage repressor protein C with HTH and peptisase S24 domain
MLGVTRQTVLAWIKEEYFSVENLALIKDRLGINLTNKADKNIQNHSFDKSNIVTSSNISQNIMLVRLVSEYAYAGYQNGYADTEYMKTLPQEPFIVDREYKGNYVCFVVKGDSMVCDSPNAILAGDKLLARELSRDHWRDKLHITKYNFVIVTNDGIVIKQIIKHDNDKGIITVHSFNPLYEDYDINLKDVSQLFNVVAFKREL